jgi:hypothetical protein
MASSTMYWMVGLSTIGSISFGIALVAGKNLVPSPAAGMIAFLIFFNGLDSFLCTFHEKKGKNFYFYFSMAGCIIILFYNKFPEQGTPPPFVPFFPFCELFRQEPAPAVFITVSLKAP